MAMGRLIVIAGLTAGIAGVSAAHAASYTFTTVDAPGATGTALFGLNDAGAIVGNTGGTGYSRVSGFEYSNGSFTPVMLPSTATGANGPVSAVGINDAGTITGSYNNSTLPAVPGSSFSPGKEVGYTLNGSSFSTIDVNPFDSQPRGLNNTGAVVGRVEGPSPGSIGPFLTQNGTPARISPAVPPGNLYNFVNYNAVNDAGDIALSFLTNTQQSALYKNGVTTLLTDPAGFATSAYGINNADTIVGGYSSGVLQGFAYSNIVDHGFIYRDGAYNTVDVPGATATTIRDINDLGVIVGDYVDPSGVDHGFIGTPDTAVPEPSSAALMGAALLGIIGLAKRGADRSCRLPSRNRT